ncbi:hypothetical protein ACIRJR_09565 [Streptomyces sp. NPDC102402]|uniref:hypothetical protein n=1 Tax=Streptomyces sp. NPDC102402 TaxID=3366169 RepID=UPI00382CEC11
MATPDNDRQQRLADLVIQRRIQLGWHKIDAANAAELTITTYARVEKGLPVRDVTYAKIERALGWAPGACDAVLQGANEAQLAGEVADGVRYAPAPLGQDDDARQAVQDAYIATRPETPAGEMAEMTTAILVELRKRGIIGGRDASP